MEDEIKCHKCGQTALLLIGKVGSDDVTCEPCLGRNSTKIFILPKKEDAEKNKKNTDGKE